MKKTILFCLLFLLAGAANAQPLLNESFNVTTATSTLPTGWTVSSTGSTNACNGIDWMQVPSGGFNCTVNGTPSPRPNGQSGTGMAGYNSWDISSGGISVMVSPALNFSALGSYTMSFWVFNQNTQISNAHDSLKVYVNTTPGIAGGTLLYANDPNYNSSPAGWAQHTFTIPTTFTGTTNYIVFWAKSNWGQDIFIDDVLVDRIPPTPCSGTPLSPSITTAAMTGIPLCQNSTKTINAVDPNLPMTAGITHQWQSSTTATGPWSPVTTGTGGTTLSYTTGPLTSSTYFRIGSTCTTSSITSYSGAYFVPIGAPQPGSITGSTTFCPGDPATYSVPNVTGTTYSWTLPSGWSGTSTTNSIMVTPGTTAGTIAVTATTSCGTSIPQTMNIIAGSAPAQPGAITGNNNICYGTTQTYSVAPVTGATSYVWTLPPGWTGTSSSNSITTTANSNPGNVKVQAINGCGQSSVTSLAVTVITFLNSPGTISGQDTVCSGAMQTYSINPVPGATSYTWTLPSGWSGTTSGTSIQTFAGATSGSLTVTAYVACATSPISTKPVVVTSSVNPSVTIAAPATLMCQGTTLTITATPAFPGNAPSYVWKKNGVVVAAFGSNYTSNTLKMGDTVSVTMTSNAVCAANTTAVSNSLVPNITPSVMPGVSINTVPPVTICKGTPVTFSTISAGTGSTPAYQWYKNGLLIPFATSTTYTDPALVNADTISIQMTTSAQCAIAPVANSNKVGVRVDDPVVPTVTISASPSNIITTGQPTTFTATHSGGGTTPDYQWQKNGVNIPFETNDTYISSTLQPGDHISVKMLSYADCVQPGLVTSNTVIMRSSLSVSGQQQGQDMQISLYPNPNSGRFTIAASSWDAAYSGKQVRIDVLSAIGQSVYHAELIPNGSMWQTQVSLGAGLANGRYMLRVSIEGAATRTTLPFILNR